ncbi:MAG: diguanylate cyclase, partial [Angelakisella sp.]
AARLAHLSQRDDLRQRLEQLLAQTRRNGGMAAVLFIDLDHFKKINDTHGHETGDLLLVAVSPVAAGLTVLCSGGIFSTALLGNLAPLRYLSLGWYYLWAVLGG